MELTLDKPAGLVPDLTGPKVYGMADLSRGYLQGPSRFDSPELANVWRPDPSTFDAAEDAPRLVARVFGRAEVEWWDAPLITLPDERAVRDYLVARYVAPQPLVPPVNSSPARSRSESVRAISAR